MVVLDTSVIIDHLRRPPGQPTYLKKLAKKFGRDLSIAMVTVQEIYEGKSTREKKKEEEFLMTISGLRILPFTFEVAQLAGQIARDLARGIDLGDAAIAATTIINGGQLATLNKKDFLGIDGLELD